VRHLKIPLFGRASAWLCGASGARTVILLYHRIAEPDLDPWGLAVAPRHFKEHLEVVRQLAYPLSLAELNDALATGRLPRNSVVITFDDGYADNLIAAKPLLERYDIPATVFVASGAIRSSREFWWDELERVFLQPGSLPPELRLEIDSSEYVWSLQDSAVYSAGMAERYRMWRASDGLPSGRHRAYHGLCRLLRAVDAESRLQITDQIVAWAGLMPDSRMTHRALTKVEVQQLAEGRIVEVGAHTITHPALSSRPVGEQEVEIRGSKAALEDILNAPVRSFSFPFGGTSTYSSKTLDLVRAAGFTCACTTTQKTVSRSADPYQLPRVYVYDWDGDQFARMLSRRLRIQYR